MRPGAAPAVGLKRTLHDSTLYGEYGPEPGLGDQMNIAHSLSTVHGSEPQDALCRGNQKAHPAPLRN